MTAVQLALFGEEKAKPREKSRGFARYPGVPGYKAAGTSQEAAGRVAGDASRLRAAVLGELRGKTADEIARLMNRSPLSVRPRLSELRAACKVVATDERRRNESGMTATVWRAA
jgi:hypothetical protein